MDIQTKRKFKFGSLAVALTAAVIAVIVVLNVIIYSLAVRYNWFFDMTPDSIYSLSDKGKSFLDEIDGSENKVTIYFLADEEQMTVGATSADYYGNNTLWGMKPIHELAKDIAEKYDFISVEYINLTNQPNLIRRIVGSDYYNSVTFSRLSIIIDNVIEYKDQSGTVYDTKHNFKVYSRDAFYTFDYSTTSVDAFRGEYRFCSAIASVTVREENAPVAYFISGHGEEIGEYVWTEEDKSNNYGGAQSIWQLFRDCGYIIRRINLAYEDFGKDKNAVAVIYSPKTDFIDKTTSQNFDEIAKLSAFLSEKDHSLYLCLDYGTQKLPVLEGFVSDSFGVEFGSAKLTDSGANSVSVDGFAISAGFNDSSSGNSGKILGAAFGEAEKSKAIFNIARSLKADAAKSSEIICTVPESVENNDGGNGLLCVSQTTGGGIALISGASNFTTGYYLDSFIYSNRNIMLSAIDEMTAESLVPVGLPFKLIKNEGLDITHKQALVWTIILTGVLPTVFAVAGLAVYIRRRHS